MTPGAILERAQRVADVRCDAAAPKPNITSALESVREMRAWVDAQEAGLVQQLARVDSFP